MSLSSNGRKTDFRSVNASSILVGDTKSLNMSIWKQLEGGYKSNYTIKNFNLNVLKEAISEFTNELSKEDREKIREEERLEKEKYEKTYYKPKFEDMYEGLELEIQTSWGWFKGTWPDIINYDTHTNLFGGNTLESKFNYASLRIKR